MLFGKEPILSAIMSSAMVLFMSSAMAHMSLRRNCGEFMGHAEPTVHVPEVSQPKFLSLVSVFH